MIKTNIVGQSFVSTTEMVKCYTNCCGLYDKRLGGSHYGIYRSHLSVPGPNGKFGFGGSCLPKDSYAMIKYAENLEVCPERDWEVLEGKIISKEGEINER